MVNKTSKTKKPLDEPKTVNPEQVLPMGWKKNGENSYEIPQYLKSMFQDCNDERQAVDSQMNMLTDRLKKDQH